MSLFPSLGISGSGLTAFKTWIEATSDNVANINTVRSTADPAYQTRRVIFYEDPTGGVVRTGTVFGSPEGKLISDPTHPLADEQGLVRAPDTDLSTEMTSLIIAQRAYQANVSAFERARDAYARELEIGK